MWEGEYRCLTAGFVLGTSMLPELKSQGVKPEDLIRVYGKKKPIYRRLLWEVLA